MLIANLGALLLPPQTKDVLGPKMFDRLFSSATEMLILLFWLLLSLIVISGALLLRGRKNENTVLERVNE
jgi:hypothetical protein